MLPLFKVHKERNLPSLWQLITRYFVPQILLISIIFGFVVMSSTAVYMAFYQFYVPALGASYPLYFDFTSASFVYDTIYDCTMLGTKPHFPLQMFPRLHLCAIRCELHRILLQLSLHPDSGIRCHGHPRASRVSSQLSNRCHVTQAGAQDDTL